MDKVSLGKLIREARLNKKMTQSEVAGTFITRNMLSLIESGSATPSMATLEYLAGVLDISPAVLMENAFMGTKNKLLDAKSAISENDFDTVINIIGEPDENDMFYDEFCALLTIAYRGKGDAKSIEKAEHFSKLGIYSKR
ncbi:MAG: helix-turn-helix transcriptional regulator [Clostridia bacterium]|nr:helix-turn-helix transcriptional regulator [Clostridia bacterium]